MQKIIIVGLRSGKTESVRAIVEAMKQSAKELHEAQADKAPLKFPIQIDDATPGRLNIIIPEKLQPGDRVTITSPTDDAPGTVEIKRAQPITGERSGTETVETPNGPKQPKEARRIISQCPPECELCKTGVPREADATRTDAPGVSLSDALEHAFKTINKLSEADFIEHSERLERETMQPNKSDDARRQFDKAAEKLIKALERYQAAKVRVFKQETEKPAPPQYDGPGYYSKSGKNCGTLSPFYKNLKTDYIKIQSVRDFVKAFRPEQFERFFPLAKYDNEGAEGKPVKGPNWEGPGMYSACGVAIFIKSEEDFLSFIDQTEKMQQWK